MLQAGHASERRQGLKQSEGSDPQQIKNRLRTGLDCLRKSMEILKVGRCGRITGKKDAQGTIQENVILLCSFSTKKCNPTSFPLPSCSLKAALKGRSSLDPNSRCSTSLHLWPPLLHNFEEDLRWIPTVAARPHHICGHRYFAAVRKIFAGSQHSLLSSWWPVYSFEEDFCSTTPVHVAPAPRPLSLCSS